MNSITRLASLRAPPWFAVLAVAACVSLSVASAAPPDDEDYRLTSAGFEQYKRATDRLYEYIDRHPELQGELDGDDEEDTDSVEEMVAALERRAPGLRDSMESSGMSLEEYFTFSLALAGSAFGVAMEEQLGGIDESALGAVELENMEFLRTNRAGLDHFFAEMQQKYPGLFADPEYDEEVLEYEAEDWDDEE